ncbi:MAG: aspartate kinase [Solirubrobacterales bacterium]
MPIIVQKYGGTSLAEPDQREQVCRNVLRERRLKNDVVVVVSAMGRARDPYATDTLISLAQEENSLPAAREMDLLMACGEIISGVVLTARLQAMGESAVFLTGMQAGITTNEQHGDARIIGVDTTMIQKSLKDGNIVVVAGFQGITEEGQITTLGRGGSDVTASALGVALGAEVVDIYTDVEGIMTADPRIVENARILDFVTYNEICQLAHEGAKVIHPRAVEIAMEANVPLRIRSTFSDHPGTLVRSITEGFGRRVNIRRDQVITGVTQRPDITQFKVRTNQDAGMPLKIFKTLALADISVDFITVNPEIVMFTVDRHQARRAAELLETSGMEPLTEPDCAKVAIVGAAMTGIPGIMARVVEALSERSIPILQSGDSYTNIWCLVRRQQMELAVQALHDKFELGG